MLQTLQLYKCLVDAFRMLGTRTTDLCQQADIMVWYMFCQLDTILNTARYIQMQLLCLRTSCMGANAPVACLLY